MGKRIILSIMLWAVYAGAQSGDKVSDLYNVILIRGSQGPVLKYPVIHVVGVGADYGYLYVSKDKIRYQAIAPQDKIGDSFEWPRDEVVKAHTPGWGFAKLRFSTEEFLIKSRRHGEVRLIHTTREEVEYIQKVGGHIPDFPPDQIISAVNDFDHEVAKVMRMADGVNPPAPPKPAVAALRLVSTPGDAQVYLDGVFKGQTSDSGDLVIESTPGDHELRLDRADYKEWKSKITLAGERTEQKIDLVKRGPEPLSVDEIDQALSQGMTAARCAELVKQYGVSFALTPDIDKQLRAKGADDALLLTIAESKR
jgi:PEGA domain-containing protein